MFEVVLAQGLTSNENQRPKLSKGRGIFCRQKKPVFHLLAALAPPKEKVCVQHNAQTGQLSGVGSFLLPWTLGTEPSSSSLNSQEPLSSIQKAILPAESACFMWVCSVISSPHAHQQIIYTELSRSPGGTLWSTHLESRP